MAHSGAKIAVTKPPAARAAQIVAPADRGRAPSGVATGAAGPSKMPLRSFMLETEIDERVVGGSREHDGRGQPDGRQRNQASGSNRLVDQRAAQARAPIQP